MTGTSARSTVHLVGSAPFATAEEMFRAAEAHLGRHLKRLPDGEVGEAASELDQVAACAHRPKPAVPARGGRSGLCPGAAL